MATMMVAVGGRIRLLVRPMVTMAVSRLVVLGALHVETLVYDKDVRGLLRMWDGRWYELIAQDWYPHNVYGTDGKPVGLFAFFPVYPALVRAVHFVTPFGISDSASIVSFALALLFAALFWLFVRDITSDDRIADRAVALFAFFPGAFILTVHYSDAAMLCPAVGCLLLLRRRHWLLAGLCAAVCTAARSNGIVIVLCCAWAAGLAIKRDREWRALLAPVLAPLGVGLHFLYLWRHTGHALPWYVAEHEGWHEQASWTAPIDRVRSFLENTQHDYQGWLIIATMCFALIALVLLLRDRPPATVLIWTFGILGVALFSQVVGMRPRMALTAFPLFIPLAKRLKPEMTFALTIAVFACAQVALVMISDTQNLFLIP
jgi:hypothetical protein